MSIKIDRRSVIKAGAATSLLSTLGLLGGCSGAVTPSNQVRTQEQWDAEANLIRERINPPTFPDYTVEITAFGAQEDVTDSTTIKAINEAIEHVSQQGGGKVVIPKGLFFSQGPVHLKSNVNLHVSEGATLLFSTTPSDYLPYVLTRWEGMELMGYSPLIYAYQQTNIAITGKGTIDGGGAADNWWPWKGKWKTAPWGDHPVENQKFTRQALMKMVEQNVPPQERVFESNYLRPPMIQPYSCDNVLIEGVSIVRSPFWLVNPVLCKNVTVKDIYCKSYGPNSDGCDPESCTDVLITGCVFDTGDDCIAIKSGRNNDGRRVNVPTANIIIEDCEMRAGHGGVVIGSEISGGVNNLYAQRCVMSSPDLDRGIRIKTNSVRGGHLKNLNYRNITIGQVKDAIVVNFFYEEGDGGPFPPILEDISIEELKVENANRAFMLRGFSHTPISGLTLANVNIDNATSESVVENVTGLTTHNVIINGESVSFEGS